MLAAAVLSDSISTSGTPREPGRDHGILDVDDHPDVFEFLLQHPAPRPETR